MKVAIVGGSIAGLMHGVMLKHHGHTVHILERSTGDLEAQGAGVSTAIEVSTFLKAHDRIALPIALHSNGLRVFDQHTNLKRRMTIAMQMCTWDAMYYRLRANFDGLATEYCPSPPADLTTDGKAIYDFGKEVVAIEDNGPDKPITIRYLDKFTQSQEQQSIAVDLVIGADGASSTIKRLVAPGAPPRQYSGYVAWRGIIPELSVSKATRETLFGSFTLHTALDEYVVVYPIPGKNGSLVEGERALNFVWYTWETEDGLRNILTDCDGHRHRWSVPAGKLRKDIWEKQKTHGLKTHTKEFADMLRATETPFVQAISDCPAPSELGAAFCHGRVLLVGDAQGLIRPHAGFALNQAAQHCAEIERRLPQIESLPARSKSPPEQMIRGDASVNSWNQTVLEFHHVHRLRSVAIGMMYLRSRLRWLPAMLRWKTAEFLYVLRRKWRDLTSG